eukprot:3842503-Rhodomonas_salina.2
MGYQSRSDAVYGGTNTAYMVPENRTDIAYAVPERRTATTHVTVLIACAVQHRTVLTQRAWYQRTGGVITGRCTRVTRTSTRIGAACPRSPARSRLSGPRV